MLRILLRRPAVEQATGKSRSAIYRDIDNGTFPAPVSLGGNMVGWPEDEIAALNAARIAGRSDAEIRVLVTCLMNARNDVVPALRNETEEITRTSTHTAPWHKGGITKRPISRREACTGVGTHLIQNTVGVSRK
ncbi:hypothetical protein CSQ89_15630 [Chitinimonas sp. BJB300]|nr:hypothetical protein CSQ89_15630 [Chitinimonas sp. BJB300]TSJ91679.1 AlpA family phage regulatory protein [Chitinimonas sp. BJB300]